MKSVKVSAHAAKREKQRCKSLLTACVWMKNVVQKQDVEKTFKWQFPIPKK